MFARAVCILRSVDTCPRNSDEITTAPFQQSQNHYGFFRLLNGLPPACTCFLPFLGLVTLLLTHHSLQSLWRFRDKLLFIFIMQTIFFYMLLFHFDAAYDLFFYPLPTLGSDTFRCYDSIHIAQW